MGYRGEEKDINAGKRSKVGFSKSHDVGIKRAGRSEGKLSTDGYTTLGQPHRAVRLMHGGWSLN